MQFITRFIHAHGSLMWLLFHWSAACAATDDEGADRQAYRQANDRSFAATRTATVPRIDGLLNEACWAEARVLSSFTTATPVFGKPSGYQTDVRLLYDNDAVYVSAYMHDTDPSRIARQLCNRDQVEQSNIDYFSFGLDTYHDRQNAFKFVVSAGGVQSDIRMSPNNYDYNWDAVWTSRTSLQADGWIAEIKIPYGALRFPKKDVQAWGINFVRGIQHNNETSSWIPIDPNVSGVVNQWGDITDLQQIQPPLRLMLLPYLGSWLRHSPNQNTAPTDYTTQRAINGGMDIKYGINESFTLDMTLIPDFGQVQSDGLVLNLGPFEQQFSERRPFFTEGIELFNKADLFYSRRIGGRPIGYFDAYDQLADDEVITANPTETQLLNATKFSGRTTGNLGVGVLNAVSAPMFATIKNTTTNQTRRYQTAPLTNYHILVLDKAMKNNSSVGFINTNVWRAGGRRDANVSAGDVRLTGKKNTYSLTANAKVSQIYQADNDRQIGYSHSVSYAKVSGNFRFDVGQTLIDRQFNPNDLGILFRDNSVNNQATLKYMVFKPKGAVLNWDSYAGFSQSYRYVPFAFQSSEFNVGGSAFFKNYWNVSVYSSFSTTHQNDFFEPRSEGRKFVRPPYYYAGFWARTDTRKKVYVMFTAGMADSTNPNDMYYEATTEPNFRISDRVQLALNISASKDFSNFGWVNTLSNNDIIIGRRSLNTVSNMVSLQYGFTPRMSLSFYSRHYWSRVSYYDYHLLNTDGSLSPATDYNESHSGNFNAFNIDVVYSWEFKPGSRLIVTWKDAILESDDLPKGDYMTNTRKTFQTPQTNFFAIKLLYFLDYGQIKNWFA